MQKDQPPENKSLETNPPLSVQETRRRVEGNTVGTGVNVNRITSLLEGSGVRPEIAREIEEQLDLINQKLQRINNHLGIKEISQD